MIRSTGKYDSLLDGVQEVLQENEFDGVWEVVSLLVNEAMRLECAQHLQASFHEQTSERE